MFIASMKCLLNNKRFNIKMYASKINDLLIFLMWKMHLIINTMIQAESSKTLNNLPIKISATLIHYYFKTPIMEKKFILTQ